MGSGNPFSRGDAEGAENFPPGLDPGRRFINYRTDPFTGLHPRRDSGRESQYSIFNNQSSRFNGQGGAGSGNPFSRKDAEGAEDVPPGSNPGRGRAAERGGF